MENAASQVAGAASSAVGSQAKHLVLMLLYQLIAIFGGAYFAARVVGETPRNAVTIGVCMNTRALMELIALNIGYDLHVLPRPMFTILVIMVIVSTFMATPLIRWRTSGAASSRRKSQSGRWSELRGRV
jgi:Kef-type K+ transport system membrane component KefB